MVVAVLGAAGLFSTISAVADEGSEVPSYVESAPIHARGFRGRHPVEGHGFTYAGRTFRCGPTTYHDTSTDGGHGSHQYGPAVPQRRVAASYQLVRAGWIIA